MDLLAKLVARAGAFTGRGLNHANETFTGRMVVVSVMGGRAVTLHYTATGLDGQHLHEEFALLAPDESGSLCLWPVMEELPGVMPHHASAAGVGTGGSTSDGARGVFATGPRDATDRFREEIGVECLPTAASPTRMPGACRRAHSKPGRVASFTLYPDPRHLTSSAAQPRRWHAPRLNQALGSPQELPRTGLSALRHAAVAAPSGVGTAPAHQCRSSPSMRQRA